MDVADYQEAAFLVCAAPIMIGLAIMTAMGVCAAVIRFIVVALKPEPPPVVIARDN